MNTREGVGVAAFWCSKWVEKSGMWLAKVARRGEKLVQYLKISAGFALDAKTFIELGKVAF